MEAFEEAGRFPWLAESQQERTLKTAHGKKDIRKDSWKSGRTEDWSDIQKDSESKKRRDCGSNAMWKQMSRLKQGVVCLPLWGTTKKVIPLRGTTNGSPAFNKA